MTKKYCSNCGKPIPASSSFCTYCGAPQYGTEGAFRFSDPTVDDPLSSQPVQPKGKKPIEYMPKQNLSPDSLLYFFVNYWAKSFIIFSLLIVGAVLQFQPFIFFLAGYFVVLFVIALFIYNNFMFEITEHGLGIESGVINKQRVSLPFEQIQNVNVERRLADRLLGFARVSIETAGSNSASGKAEAYIPGIHLDMAKKIHDILIDAADGRIASAPSQAV